MLHASNSCETYKKRRLYIKTYFEDIYLFETFIHTFAWTRQMPQVVLVIVPRCVALIERLVQISVIAVHRNKTTDTYIHICDRP